MRGIRKEPITDLETMLVRSGGYFNKWDITTDFLFLFSYFGLLVKQLCRLL